MQLHLGVQILLGISIAAFTSAFRIDSPPSHENEFKISCNLSDAHFLLYTRALGWDIHEEINFEHDNLARTNFDSAKRTLVLMHGFTSDYDFGERFVEGLLLHGDYNVLSIVWHKMASADNYFTAAENAILVGNHAGDFLSRLIQNGGLRHNLIHAAGHSLGAHGVGNMAKTVLAMTGDKIARLTGLDPARPFFEVDAHELDRISKNDAYFVDVIHTNSGALWDGCLSFLMPLGHVDFYPAGGKHQPGCTQGCLFGCTENDIWDLIKGGCSHDKANAYFIESINGKIPFKATKCDSFESFEAGMCDGAPTADLGFHLDSRILEGSYYLYVNEEPPYAQG